MVDVSDSNATPTDDLNILLNEQTYVDHQLYKRKLHKRYNAHHAHVPSDVNDILIEAINQLDIGWKADTCKYQKHHSLYGEHCDDESPVSLA